MFSVLLGVAALRGLPGERPMYTFRSRNEAPSSISGDRLVCRAWSSRMQTLESGKGVSGQEWREDVRPDKD